MRRNYPGLYGPISGDGASSHRILPFLFVIKHPQPPRMHLFPQRCVTSKPFRSRGCVGSETCLPGANETEIPGGLARALGSVASRTTIRANQHDAGHCSGTEKLTPRLSMSNMTHGGDDEMPHGCRPGLPSGSDGVCQGSGGGLISAQSPDLLFPSRSCLPERPYHLNQNSLYTWAPQLHLKPHRRFAYTQSTL